MKKFFSEIKQNPLLFLKVFIPNILLIVLYLSLFVGMVLTISPVSKMVLIAYTSFFIGEMFFFCVLLAVAKWLEHVEGKLAAQVSEDEVWDYTTPVYPSRQMVDNIDKVFRKAYDIKVVDVDYPSMTLIVQDLDDNGHHMITAPRRVSFEEFLGGYVEVPEGDVWQ